MLMRHAPRKRVFFGKLSNAGPENGLIAIAVIVKDATMTPIEAVVIPRLRA